MYTYDIEQLLKNGSAVKLKPQGYSMYPLFLPGRDEAVIEHCVPSELHRGDVILYRRVQGILVLHRICRARGGQFWFVGDAQDVREGPLPASPVKSGEPLWTIATRLPPSSTGFILATAFERKSIWLSPIAGSPIKKRPPFSLVSFASFSTLAFSFFHSLPNGGLDIM